MRVPGHQRKSYMWRWTAALAGLAVLSLALVMAIVVTPASKVEAATYTVDTTSDASLTACTSAAGDCSLRGAIENANASSGVTDNITFNITGAGPHTIVVGATELDDITDDHLTITAGSETIILKPDLGVGWTTLLVIDADDVSITGLILDGDDESVIAIGMLTNNDEATITNVDISDFDGAGVSFVGNNDDNVVDNVYVHDNTASGIVLSSGSDDNIIRNSDIEDNGGDGISLDDGSGNEVLNNTIEDNGDVPGDDGIDAADQSQLTISGNTISDNWDNQILITGAFTGDVTIKNNAIDVDSDGIELDATCSCEDVLISGSSAAEANCFSGSLGTDEYYVENMSADDVDAEYNYWAGDSDPDDDDICADNADNSTDCDLGEDATNEVDWNPVASSCAGPTTPTPTRTVTPTVTLTPTPGTPTSTVTPTRTSTPTGPTATPTTGPMESVTLVGGVCNPVASSYPNGTAIATIANAVSPSGILISIWKFEPSSGAWLGYSPQAPQASNLTQVNRLDAIFICVSSAGSWSRPKI